MSVIYTVFVVEVTHS